MEKYRCDSCGLIFTDEDILIGKNPFAEWSTVYGCPRCKEIEHFIFLCEDDECKEESRGGIPTKDGYKNLCSAHLQNHIKG